MSVRGLRVLQGSLRSLASLFIQLVRPLYRLTFRWFIAQPYSLLWRANRGLRQRLAETRLPELLRQRHTVSYVVLMGVLAVSLNSARIRTAAAEDFGRRNLIYPLIHDENEILVTEGLTPRPSRGVSTALPPTEVTDAGEAAPPPLSLVEGGTAILKPHLATTQPGVAGRTRIEQYAVQSGDTLSTIAQRFGLSLNTLLWENRLTERSLLRVGHQLTILPVDGVTYRIGRGDTVTGIASRYRVTGQAITEFNQLGSALSIGQTIVIPGGRPPAAPTPVAPARVATPTINPIAETVQRVTGFVWPTVNRRITQYFSLRHSGLDIADRAGTAIYATDAGIVQNAGWNAGGYGYYIIIDHGGGVHTLYGHASKLLVVAGERVERGQQIANMGSTGRSTGPHLHFEVRVAGRRVNPLNYIR